MPDDRYHHTNISSSAIRRDKGSGPHRLLRPKLRYHTQDTLRCSVETKVEFLFSNGKVQRSELEFRTEPNRELAVLKRGPVSETFRIRTLSGYSNTSAVHSPLTQCSRVPASSHETTGVVM